MTDHKFTDEEVIKALECCIDTGNPNSCQDCCFYNKSINCVYWLEYNVRALINRQKAEIAALTKHSISEKYPHCVLCSNGAILTKSLDEYDKLIADISAEAIKEFAERLKEKAYIPKPYGAAKVVDEYAVDDLVKEMTEGKDHENISD